MKGSQFDNFSRIFAQRRLSRRRALAQGSAGIAAAGLAMTGLSHALAQDATPTSTGAPGQEKTAFLFIQSFKSGTIVPKADEVGTWTLTLEQGLGQTVYFSDRPERIVGVSPTDTFLKGLGFSNDNPPNAALLFENDQGEEDISVVELFNPTYDSATHTATYEIQLLNEYAGLEMTFQEQPTEPPDAQATFGVAHLFIDGCPDTNIVCWDYVSSSPNKGQFSNQPFCYWERYGCIPCAGDGVTHDEIVAYWNGHCNDKFSACGGNCYAEWNPS